jgi:PKD repeat protein
VANDGTVDGNVATVSITISEAPSSMHVGDLDGSLENANKNFWWAEVTVAVHDPDEGPVEGATVQGTWSGGASGSGSCLTGADGTCTVLSVKIAIAQQTVSFAVDGVAHATLPYQPALNHDPDGDSDGTVIVVSQAGNQSPVAAFTYSCTDLACDCDGTGSSDADGTIAGYEWDYGDGSTGSGVTASHTYTTAGTYTVVLTVTDNGGASDDDTQGVTVSQGSGGLTLAANGYKVKGVHHADLAWSGAGSPEVDVYRDSAPIGTTANDGAYTDNIGQKGGGSYTYQVCESGTATCSNEVTVTF